jgi:hypothetical protein
MYQDLQKQNINYQISIWGCNDVGGQILNQVIDPTSNIIPPPMFIKQSNKTDLVISNLQDAPSTQHFSIEWWYLTVEENLFGFQSLQDPSQWAACI